jgi:Bacterial EndoU nuclease
MKHVLDGEVKTRVNSAGEIIHKRGVGGHYAKSPNVRVTEVIGEADKNGVVRAKIHVRDPETGGWINKRGETDLFPEAHVEFQGLI